MNEETLVAVYDTPNDAHAAIRELKAFGVPAGAITLHAKEDISAQATPGVQPPPQQHFLPRMFGYEPTPHDEHDERVYLRSLEAGASVVAVHGTQPTIDVAVILGRHNPIDLDERGMTYGVEQAAPKRAPATRVRRYVASRPAAEL